MAAATADERETPLKSTATWLGLILTALTIVTVLGAPIVEARVSLATFGERLTQHEAAPFHQETGKQLGSINERLARFEEREKSRDEKLDRILRLIDRR